MLKIQCEWHYSKFDTTQNTKMLFGVKTEKMQDVSERDCNTTKPKISFSTHFSSFVHQKLVKTHEKCQRLQCGSKDATSVCQVTYLPLRLSVTVTYVLSSNEVAREKLEHFKQISNLHYLWDRSNCVTSTPSAEAPQYTREKKSLLCTAAHVLWPQQLIYIATAVHNRLFSCRSTRAAVDKILFFSLVYCGSSTAVPQLAVGGKIQLVEGPQLESFYTVPLFINFSSNQASNVVYCYGVLSVNKKSITKIRGKEQPWFK